MPLRAAALGLAGTVAITVGLGGAACNGSVDVVGGHAGAGGGITSSDGYGGNPVQHYGGPPFPSSSSGFGGSGMVMYGPAPCWEVGMCGPVYGPANLDASPPTPPDDGGGVQDGGSNRVDGGGG